MQAGFTTFIGRYYARLAHRQGEAICITDGRVCVRRKKKRKRKEDIKNGGNINITDGCRQ
jgi:hypothetical protein